MRVMNLRRKLASALVAGGMLAPAAASAADLNVNLLANPGFESLAVEDSHILDWEDGAELGFTYASGVYDNGGPLADGGSFYFSANGGSDITAPGEASQLIDLSTGDSAALIATGAGAYQLSGFFSSYQGDGDYGILQVEFRDGAGVALGTGMVADNDTSTWTQNSIGGLIPVGTESAMVSLLAVPLSGGPDGYIDNVDFRVTDEVILPSLDLQVSRQDGGLVLANQTGGPVNISGYQITSGVGALDQANWNSIADTSDSDSGGAVDGDNVWTELTQSGGNGDLSEGDLDSGAGGSLAHGQSISLGNAGAWIANPTEDLVFSYISGGEVVSGIVNFAGGAALATGDVNADGAIDAADWEILRSNQHADLSGFSLAEAYRLGDLNGDLQNNHPDFSTFKAAFEAANGAGSFAAMVTAAQAVPEPGSIALVLAAGLLIAPAGRRLGRKS